MNQREKIFVSAYACEPGLGSEIGVGWHWVVEMSKYFDLWVLTRTSNRETIEDYLSKNQLENKITFVYYDLPEKMRFWKRGLRGVRTYYNLWQIFSNRLVKKVMMENDIKVYHLLTYGNALWKVSGYGMKQTFIWGPTGGVDTIPLEYSKHYGFKSRAIEAVRRQVVCLLKINRGFQKKCRNARLIYCKTINMYNAIPEKYRDKAMVFTDVAMERIQEKAQENTETPIQYIAVGRLDAWRGFDILIEAFDKAVRIKENIRLEILGEGADKKRLQKIIKEKQLEDKVLLCGNVKKEIYEEKMRNAHVVINPNLKEGAVTVAFDSMAMCKPLICVDTGGYTNCFTQEYAKIIKMTNRAELVEKMSEALIEMTDKNTRNSIKEQILLNRGKFAWEEKGKQIYLSIEKALVD